MDGTQQLFTNIQFAEARKGYDREQVDNFLRSVGDAVGRLQDMLRQATERAEHAEAKVADALRAKSLVEADLDRVRGELTELRERNEYDQGEIEAMRNVLLLAQKTADAAVEEARLKAHDELSGARSTATALVVEAEQRAAEITDEAQRQADALVDERRQVLEDEIRALQAAHDEAQAELEVLRNRVDVHRERLRSTLTGMLGALDTLDDVDAPTATPSSAAGSVVDPDADPDPRLDPDPVEAGDDDAVTDPRASDTTAPPAPAVPPVEMTTEAHDDPPGAEGDPTADPGPTVDEVALFGPPEPGPVWARSAPSDGDDSLFHDDAEADAQFAALVGGLTIVDAAPPEAPRSLHVAELIEGPPVAPGGDEAVGGAIDLTGPDPESEGPPTALFDVFAEQDDRAPSAFGSPDEQADEAMRAFFEQDLDELERTANRSPRFLRRR